MGKKEYRVVYFFNVQITLPFDSALRLLSNVKFSEKLFQSDNIDCTLLNISFQK